MEPERESPYWKAIVGDNWPEISPREWGRLETVARDGAEALDPDEAERARRAFDDRARSSVRLQPIKDEMLAQQGSLHAFVDALVAAADTFGRISDSVYRIRNRILDIVDQATRKIREVHSEDSSEDDSEEAERAEAAADRERAAGIIERARSEVEEAVARALADISPQGLPELDLLARLLGQPGPWDPVHPGQGGPREYHDGPYRRGGPYRQLPRGLLPPGFRLPAEGYVPSIPELRGLERLLERLGQHLPVAHLPPGFVEGLLPGGPPGGELLLPPPEAATPPANPSEDGTSTVPPPSASTPGPAPGQPVVGAAPPPGESVSGPVGSGPTGAGSVDAGSADSGAVDAKPVDTGSGDNASTLSESPDTAGDSADEGTDSGAAARSDRGSRSSETAADDTGTGAPFSALAGAQAAAAAQSPVVPQPVASAAPAAPPSAPPGQVSAPGQAGAVPAADSRFSVAAPKVSAAPGPIAPGPAAGVSAPGGPVPPVKGPPIRHDQQPVPANGETPAKPGDSVEKDGSDELVRDAVGAAMIAAAAPTFMIGERVDGDLVLARTLLSSLLAAAPVVGPAWAVSVMRSPDGISAFVTSNEGRGWLPSGLFLPRELSTPWVWSVSEGAGWEGVADPARVLAEFALAWGGKSGVRLSALASSQPIEESLRTQLGDVPTAGSVDPQPTMGFSAPGKGLADRLELVGAPQLLDRVRGVPVEQIRGRCADLAGSAHLRLARLGSSVTASLGSAAVRERILQAFRQGREVPEQWWDELQDSDDLVVASMLSLKSDVSRIPLGELRSENPTAPDLSALRAMTFERRCNELVSILAGEPTRQSLRDAIYAHGQLVDHPLFGQTASAPPEAGPVRRPTITAPPTR
ncbi:hypothetical protein [Nocardia mexicana]|uniref:Uncharacterized protein n=1 Tax=Nocardia mexicana TaxID=279262 RepID=A0A370HDJ4_9NOCA|nr:hypothetical protein [Nocardia mexicana]RDI54551.1 hypothetical protein DFR68_102679 [Nocardia mexicana]